MDVRARASAAGLALVIVSAALVVVSPVVAWSAPAPAAGASGRHAGASGRHAGASGWDAGAPDQDASAPGRDAGVSRPARRVVPAPAPGPRRPGAPRPGESKAERRARARRIYQQAVQAYNVADFARARALFSRAYETYPLPGFLFNIGQCERMLGRCPRAVFLYRRYLTARPKAANRSMVEELIAGCERTLARRAASPPRRRVAGRGAPFLPPGSGGGPKRPARPLVRQWWLWTAVGVGVAALVAGLAGGLAPRGGRAPTPGSLQTLDLRGLP